MGTLLLDTKILMKKEYSNILRYEKIEMIKPDKREELIAELPNPRLLAAIRVTDDSAAICRGPTTALSHLA